MDPRFALSAPTRDQAKKIFWDDAKRLTPPAWLARTSESDLVIYTRWGAELHVVGLDKPERIEGPGWDGIVISEFANCKAGILDAHILPALMDRKGWLWLEGVPDSVGPSQAEYKKLAQLGRSSSDPDWRDYTWRSREIVDPDEIHRTAKRMDTQLFAQEEGGEFVAASGLALPDFKAEAPHVRSCIYDPHLPICWSLDFNIDPFCSGILQHKNGYVRVIDELILKESSTPAMTTAFLERAEEKGWDLKALTIYGDATGSARDTTSGTSDWAIIKNRLRNITDVRYKVPRGSSAIKDTLNAVRALVKNAAGDIRLAIDTECKQIIEDCESALWPSDLEPWHSLSWLRYFADQEYPVVVDRGGNDNRFGFTAAPSRPTMPVVLR